jgi:hypothetical protein
MGHPVRHTQHTDDDGPIRITVLERQHDRTSDVRTVKVDAAARAHCAAS